MLNSTVRHSRFKSGGAHIAARDHSGLTIDALGDAIPSILAVQAHESRSSRFVAIPTVREPIKIRAAVVAMLARSIRSTKTGLSIARSGRLPRKCKN